MNNGQKWEKRIKKSLKFFKLNEDTFSTILGVIVIIFIAGLIYNYFKTSSLSSWKGKLLEEKQATSSTIPDITGENDNKYLVVYKVVKGDDLWHIAERFYKSGYNYTDIMKENKISGSGVITAGMELRIPKVTAKKMTVREAEAKEIVVKNGNFEQVKNKPNLTIDTGIYVTIKGDSLWDIAVRAYGDGFKWTKIYWANRKLIGNPDVIYANIKLTIPKLTEG